MSDVSIENTAVESTGKNKSKKTPAWVVIMKRELGAY